MMEQNFDAALERVRRLVADFQQHEQAYLAPSYSEMDVRKDFIDKFWIALGWDVNHEQQKNPYEQEVKVERNVDVKGRKKKADYAFLAPNFRDVRFFVEAKKPARNIDNADDYFQTIRYGWNAQAPLSVLTDFQQFRLLDCRYKPDVQAALQRAVKEFHYTEYADAEKFKEIFFLLSREAVANGALDRFAETLPKPTGKAAQRKRFGGVYKSVDEDFLQELDELRAELARSFKNRNPRLNGEELTEATQRTLDRLVFMRFLEDKLIEPETIVERLGERGSAWTDFVAESQRLDRIYNGIIFKRHAIIDDADFVVDERVFDGARERLAHTNSPYDFNSLPVHILGSIYERFLGKVIVTTDKRAHVEEKPEVRKAGGVYYTPEYIVRYIVEQTIGKLIEGKEPGEIASMRFADIACGSGSFLLGMYDELLRHHTAYYNEPQNRRKAIKAGCIENPDGSVRLSLNQRKDILLNNIYGVDLDAQAVEVAQLSLFLKLLEDETTASAKGFQLQFRETMLPPLDKNVIHGNSLIGWDISDGRLFSDEEERKLHPMDFEQSFPVVMRRGGFDAIVGNPPYVRQEVLGSFVKSYFQKHYKTYHGIADLYVYFFERDFQLLKPNGKLGIIVANKWMRANYGEPLRRWLKEQRIEEILDFRDLPVFQQATTYPCIVITAKDKPLNTFAATHIRTLNFEGGIASYVAANRYQVNQQSLENYGWALTDENTQVLLNKVRAIGVPLSSYIDNKIYRGILTGLMEAFVIDSETREQIVAQDTRSEKLIKPFLIGRDIKRYATPKSDNYVILIPKGWTRSAMSVNGQISTSKAWGWFKETYPSIANHLAPFAQVAEKRYDKGEFWWELRACDYYREFEKNKIIYAEIATRGQFTLDKSSYYSETTTYIIGSESKYLLGILNSRLWTFIFAKVSSEIRGGFLRWKRQYMEVLPIRTIDFSDKADRSRHDRMVNLVEQMLAAKRQLQAARSDSDRNFYENKCAALDRQIDALVYELYELTPEEIALVEAN